MPSQGVRDVVADFDRIEIERASMRIEQSRLGRRERLQPARTGMPCAAPDVTGRLVTDSLMRFLDEWRPPVREYDTRRLGEAAGFCPEGRFDSGRVGRQTDPAAKNPPPFYNQADVPR